MSRIRRVSVVVVGMAALLGSAVLLPTTSNALTWGGHGRQDETASTSATPLLQENWDTASWSLFEAVENGNSTVHPNIADRDAEDGKALELRLGANPDPTPAGAAEVDSKKTFLYGTFTSRLRAADCSKQPGTGVVTGAFTYFNDGSDKDKDGLPDNSEIDFEFLCSQPNVIYLTIWTDYRASDEVHQRVTRVIDLEAGKVLSTCYTENFGDCQALSGAEASPSTVPAVPGYSSSTAYHDYSFTWTSTRVTFWTEKDGKKVILWDYRGPRDRIPQRSAHYLLNVWHTTTWPTLDDPGSVKPPTSTVSAYVDRSSVTAAS
jgi:beta-glucanase (GH16 family)